MTKRSLKTKRQKASLIAHSAAALEKETRFLRTAARKIARRAAEAVLCTTPRRTPTPKKTKRKTPKKKKAKALTKSASLTASLSMSSKLMAAMKCASAALLLATTAAKALRDLLPATMSPGQLSQPARWTKKKLIEYLKNQWRSQSS